MRLGLLTLSLASLVLTSGFSPPISALLASTPEKQKSAKTRPGRAASSCNTPGNFGQYVLALSWAPSFCGGGSGRCSLGECQNLSSTFAGNHLTLHGLWPQYTDAEAPPKCSYPANCPGPAYDKSTLPGDMATYAPAYALDGLGQHEWPKHGTCSGLSQPTFYQTALRLMQSLGGDQGTPDAITKNLGGQVALATLQQAFANVPAESVTLSCDNACNLQQVGICFGADAQGNPTAAAACPRSTTGSSYDNSCVVGRGKNTPQKPMCRMIKLQAPAGTCSGSGQSKSR
jgi:ribonuclease T2